MNDFLQEMAIKWPTHEDDVKERIRTMIDTGGDEILTADYYLGYVSGLLVLTEKLKGIFAAMDENVRALYFSMISYCAFRYMEVAARGTAT